MPLVEGSRNADPWIALRCDRVLASRLWVKQVLSHAPWVSL